MIDGIYCMTQQAQKYQRLVNDVRKVYRLNSKKQPKKVYDTCLVSPFANKRYCLKKYLSGIRLMPTDNMCAVVYDNSNSEKFHKEISKAFGDMFPHFLHIIDENQHFTIDTSNDYNLIDDRLHFIYRNAFKWMPMSKNVFVVEDDVQVPSGSYEKLSAILSTYPEVATAVACVRERRKIFEDAYRYPNMWYMREIVSCETGEKRVELELIKKEKPFGIELIGSSHTGCWMTRRSVIKEIGVEPIKDVRYFDQAWGYHLYKRGYKIVVDWSIKCKHYHKILDKVGYV